MTKKNDFYGNLVCSFCGKSQREVKKLIAGPSVYICDECIELCNDIIAEETQKEESRTGITRIPKPVEIKQHLDEYVIGQEDAKKTLAVAVYNHYKRINSAPPKAGEAELQKSNILLIGPTGCGKTYLAQTIAKILNVPFTIADATCLTEAGYVGEDVENVVLSLLQAADYDIERCQKGVIYVDEIDKVSRKSENPSITRDVSGEGVQQALLKIIEGTIASIPPKGGRKHPQQDFLQVDTSNILFICGGAFVGLDKIIEQRIDRRSLGLGADVKSVKEKDVSELLKTLQPDDLVKFGLIPEFVGRVPVITTLESLNEDAFLEILVKPRNALVKQFERLFALENVSLKFRDDALRAIAHKAMDRKVGARGLRAILEESLVNTMFDLPSMVNVKECIVDKNVITKKAAPKFVFEEKKESDDTGSDSDTVESA